ncbi:unnamed protein product [Nippostrongylus brasiliensis]|uniref:Ricin B-type lectin domain-containing protein n=1 Tax=Nippostrongylus brasiliensis TaxID=27835 RepID=A0A0N4YIP5_NIPBR|nr:unnamed protein product [Nippostrongylus brasiliensis]
MSHVVEDQVKRTPNAIPLLTGFYASSEEHQIVRLCGGRTYSSNPRTIDSMLFVFLERTVLTAPPRQATWTIGDVTGALKASKSTGQVILMVQVTGYCTHDSGSGAVKWRQEKDSLHFVTDGSLPQHCASEWCSITPEIEPLDGWSVTYNGQNLNPVVAEAKMSPKYDACLYSNDIAVLELDQDILFDNALPICLPDDPLQPSQQELMVANYVGVNKDPEKQAIMVSDDSKPDYDH